MLGSTYTSHRLRQKPSPTPILGGNSSTYIHHCHSRRDTLSSQSYLNTGDLHILCQAFLKSCIKSKAFIKESSFKWAHHFQEYSGESFCKHKVPHAQCVPENALHIVISDTTFSDSRKGRGEVFTAGLCLIIIQELTVPLLHHPKIRLDST